MSKAMFPDLSALTAGGFADVVPKELVELVKERGARTNPLRIAVLVFQKKELGENANIVRLRVKSNIRSLRRLLASWGVGSDVRNSLYWLVIAVIKHVAKRMRDEIVDKFKEDLRSQEFNYHTIERAVDADDTINMEPIERSVHIPAWNDESMIDPDNEEEGEMEGYDISEYTWNVLQWAPASDYTHVDLHEKITENRILNHVDVAWDHDIMFSSKVPSSGEWTVRTAASFDGREKDDTQPVWYKLFYAEKEVETIPERHFENLKPDKNPESGQSRNEEGKRRIL